MSIDLKVPALPESIADATVAQWHKKEGDTVKRDEVLLELETDKVMLEVPAPQDGVLEKILKPVGSQVTPHEILGTLSSDSVSKAVPAEIAEPKPEKTDSAEKSDTSKEKESAPKQEKSPSLDAAGPAARRLMNEHDLKPEEVEGTGKGGRVTKDDVLAKTAQPAPTPTKQVEAPAVSGERTEQRVPMSRLRARIAERLVAAQHEAAMLTTFNEVNMQPVMDLRTRYKDTFEKAHQTKLGFMSFFVKAAVEALKRFPAINASIDGTDVIYHGYYDVGIAISSPRGLVVPVLRNADSMSMADVEKEIANYSEKAKQAKLTIEDMTGGTFTITNGGTFGSMLSTPILNPPQSAILGMHNIVKRPVVENDQIVIRPIMYLALSYDHRLVDGKESVRFLYTIKELLEDPSRLVLGV